MAELLINDMKMEGHINPELQGQFSEHLGRGIYEGIFVKEDSGIPNVNGMRQDVVNALKKIHVPVLRWPGGCFADEYHWMDGIGPRDQRKKMVNTNWGGVIEDNSFGTHEYFELLSQLGCKSYINGNVGSGTVREMSEWMEYMMFGGKSPMADLRRANGQDAPWHVDWFGVGNENWGCGGNMRPAYYADLYRRYQSFLRQYDPEHPVKKVACGPNSGDQNWTRKVLDACCEGVAPEQHGLMDGLSLHYYTVPTGVWSHKGSSLDFSEEEWYQTFRQTLVMEDLIRAHSAIMDQYDPAKQIGMVVDEWGTWYDVEPGTNPGFLYQQNTTRDAIVAGINLNIFNKHCDRVKMTCIAQTINVLQSMIHTEGEKMTLTPTYHVFDLYQHHQDAELLESTLTGGEMTGARGGVPVEIPALSESVSTKDGVITVTMTNADLAKAYPVNIRFASARPSKVTGRIVTGAMNAHNTVDQTDNVKAEDFTEARITGDGAAFEIPPRSVVLLQFC